MKNSNIPTIVIAGPTANGKSSIAMELAEKIGAEIICADSRTVYKEASIGTAKPSKVDQAKVKHYGLDLVNLGQSFTAQDFKIYAKKIINEIKSKNKVPMIVGGSGLYIDGLVYDFSFLPSPVLDIRSKLNNLSISELQNIINQQNLPMPSNKLNKRHLIRVIETKGKQPKKSFLPPDVIYTGLLLDDTQIKASINKRVEDMYDNDFLEEVIGLSNNYTDEQIASAGTGYKDALRYIRGEIDIDTAKQLFKQSDWQLARRQKTWFKRNKDTAWFDNKNELQTHILTRLNK